MAVNKVTCGDSTLIDLTADSVTPENLLRGKTAYNSAGEPITGTAHQPYRNGLIFAPGADTYAYGVVGVDRRPSMFVVRAKGTTTLHASNKAILQVILYNGNLICVSAYTGNIAVSTGGRWAWAGNKLAITTTATQGCWMAGVEYELEICY